MIRPNGCREPSQNLGFITHDCHRLTVLLFSPEDGESISVWIGQAKTSSFYHLLYKSMIARPAMEASHVLIEERGRGAVLEEIQKIVRSGICEITQIDFWGEFVNVAQRSIQRMSEKNAVGCASSKTLDSLALIEASPVLLDHGCVFVVFPHEVLVQILDHITSRRLIHLGGTSVAVDAGELEESQGRVT